MIEVNSNPEIVQATQNIQPTMPEQFDDKPRKQPFFLWIIIAVFLVVVGAMLFYVVSGGHSSNTKSSPSVVPTSNGASPTPKVTDLAPSLAANQKTVVLIQDSDSSFEKVIVPSVQVATYIKSLPEGTRYVSQSPDK